MKTMISKPLYLLLLFVMATAFQPVLALADTEVIGKGRAEIFNNNEGSARRQAKANALRNAVEKGVGMVLDSKTITKNWQVIKDEIFSSSRGFVKRHEVLRDEREGSAWIVEIKAQVSKKALSNKLGELRILHKKMGNKRLMVIYRAEHIHALEPNHRAVDAATTAMEQELMDSGFRLFDRKILAQAYENLDPMRKTPEPVKTWIKAAKDQRVDILVEFQLLANYAPSRGGFNINAARTTVQMKIYDVSTGRLIASNNTSQKQLTNARVGSYDWNAALSHAGAKSGRMAAGEGVRYVVDYYKKVGDIGNSYMIRLENLDEDSEDKVLFVLESLEGYQSLSELKNTPEMIEVEYFSNLSKSRLRRLIRLKAKENGIRLLSKDISGNRLVFTKP